MMNPRLLLLGLPVRFAALLMSVVLLGGCASDSAKVRTVRIENQSEAIHVDRGGRFEVVLDSNPTTGYRWMLVDSAGGIVEPVGQVKFEKLTSPPGMVGVGGTERWRFRATRRGEGVLRFEYRRESERALPPARVATFAVQVGRR